MNKFLSAINFIIAGLLLGTILEKGGEWWVGVAVTMNLVSGIWCLSRD